VGIVEINVMPVLHTGKVMGPVSYVDSEFIKGKSVARQRTQITHGTAESADRRAALNGDVSDEVLMKCLSSCICPGGETDLQFNILLGYHR
jgi:hypothetical protein